MFKLIAIIALLVVGSYAKKISVSSSGAYVARCFIDIKDDSSAYTLATGNIYAGQTFHMELPDDISWMKIRCENQRLVGKWGEVFSQELSGPRPLCYNVGGTTFHPHHSATIC
ncbi:unnamed protein product [Rotaria magnacalcarata]|uniref:Uncharacterized protein n=3 Tax=Rotaria magnacalcarata TaxID=392030 RepID=A0A818YSN7_9BILA|nr:unnamed protein product [Rotaria magnacalcarata]CAF1483907.1 unnamed protein product [Rotaria magnacalcarata]CAF1904355.1 unnamed protein product [Rotaria magnacalcarata]CAF2079745.1 unnamed protein product [Rotaria magnacalcarata]CAF2244125.1 unnamed protein product [Rotaria magnacalcarata]